ncbi:hypothetical protein CXB51_009631 [Gossypium anomalum]|uniref:Disease resistance protein At4g27190-like leucine-rich repeats domain-containing protein n=1 Tax=Gossypium anomalum TaxID=47600 RepID=A0A8J5YM25_9ROSI|nr:hypothetical protein CXB51_009631 [Gossypium anomalum]
MLAIIRSNSRFTSIKNYLHLENIIQDPQVLYISVRSFREVEVKKICSQLKKNNPNNTNIKHMSTLMSKGILLIDLPQLKGADPNEIILTRSSLHKLKDLVLWRMKNEQSSNLYTCNYEELDQDQTSSQHHLRPIWFPSLTLIDILECESLKFLFPITVDHGGPKELNAPNLQTLKIKRCSGLEEIIQDPQVSNISFQCLREIQVIGCNNLKYIFPISVADSLGQLHTLKIKSCSQLEDITQYPQVSHINLQSLREVEVNKCNKLKYLFPQSVAKILGQLLTLKIKNPQVPNISLQCLREVEVQKCYNLKFLFPMSVAGSLKQLQTLKISNCSQLEKIIQGTQVSNISLLQRLREVWLKYLPQLKARDVKDIMPTESSLQKLIVSDCPQLTPVIISNKLRELVLGRMKNEQLNNMYICNYEESSQHHLQAIDFSHLTLIDILECENLKFLFPFTVAHGETKNLKAPNLQALKIKGCSELEEIIQYSEVSNISFRFLREVQVTGCNKLKYLFSMSVVNSLEKLQTLKIWSCFELQEIIKVPKVSISMTEYLELLNEVELVNLPQLKGRAINDMLASRTLHKLKVMGCPQLTPFIITTNIQVLEFSEMTNRKQKSKVIVPKMRGGTSRRMEYLTISNFEELFEYSRYSLSSLDILNLSELSELRVIWSGCIQVEHFQNLTQLAVKDCKRLRYIFSSTMARNLPQLMRLDISDCEELEQIIEKDQTSSQHHLFPNLTVIDILRCKNLKCLFPVALAHGGLSRLYRLNLKRVTKLEQVFEGDEANVGKDEEKVIHLPQLNTMMLDGIPNLVSFSPMGYHFVFLSLRLLQVGVCPNITTRFSVDSKQSVHAKTTRFSVDSKQPVHAKTQASQLVDEIIEEEPATTQETAWSIGSNIWWMK